jgi:hypothetical protein
MYLGDSVSDEIVLFQKVINIVIYVHYIWGILLKNCLF